ncbi:hypothetical protein BH09MYX1_BH09MYX1_13770 [soil metagenome]
MYSSSERKAAEPTNAWSRSFFSFWGKKKKDDDDDDDLPGPNATSSVLIPFFALRLVGSAPALA